MRATGILCEYNPFHNGHAHQLQHIRQSGTDVIVALMSGHATQRGEWPIADKFVRAKMALYCGVDVVLELPYPFSAASASYFSGAGVAILDALGVDCLCFGSECGDKELLAQAAQVAEEPLFLSRIQERQKQGLGSAKAFFDVLQEMGLPLSPSSNDILGIEYMRAARRMGSKMEMDVIQRQGSHFSDTVLTQNRFPSAMAIRKAIKEGEMDTLRPYMPQTAWEILCLAHENGEMPSDANKLSNLILGFFRTSTPQMLSGIAEMGGGLAYKLCNAAQQQTCLEGFFSQLNSKTYTNARLRRAVLFALTGVTQELLRTPPAYLQLLGATQIGRQWLKENKKSGCPLPIFAKAADAQHICPKNFALSKRLDGLFALTLPKAKPSDYWIKHPPILQKTNV